jgi:hypothetical protein
MARLDMRVYPNGRRAMLHFVFRIQVEMVHRSGIRAIVSVFAFLCEGGTLRIEFGRRQEILEAVPRRFG